MPHELTAERLREVLGREFVGIEIEPKYFDIACRRISEALAQPDMFIEPPKPAKQEAMF